MRADSILVGVCVVTHKERFSSTPAYESLSRLPAELRSRLRVVSVCNSAPAHLLKEAISVVESDSGLSYTEIARDDNLGLAGGYNVSLPVALQTDAEAVLFLNADAVVIAPYIEWLFESLRCHPEFSGFSPTLTSRGAQVSPFRKRGLSMPFYIIGYLCLRSGPFVEKLKFPHEFWLDGIDYWLSAELERSGQRIQVSAQRIEHNLSVSDQFDTLPPWRYRNILLSERRFLTLQSRPFTDIFIVHLRALLRCLRYRRIDLALVAMQEFKAALHER